MIEAMIISGTYVEGVESTKSWCRPMVSRADIVEIFGPDDDMKMSEEEFFRRAIKYLQGEGLNVENAAIHQVEYI